MSYQIAVPSYKRYEILKTQTLPTLDKLKADRDKIHIFVANEEEEEKYRAVIGDDYRIVVGQRGISTQRKYIHNWSQVYIKCCTELYSFIFNN
jgi:predicted CoA-binding protein